MLQARKTLEDVKAVAVGAEVVVKQVSSFTLANTLILTSTVTYIERIIFSSSGLVVSLLRLQERK